MLCFELALMLGICRGTPTLRISGTDFSSEIYVKRVEKGTLCIGDAEDIRVQGGYFLTGAVPRTAGTGKK